MGIFSGLRQLLRKRVTFEKCPSEDGRLNGSPFLRGNGSDFGERGIRGGRDPVGLQTMTGRLAGPIWRTHHLVGILEKTAFDQLPVFDELSMLGRGQI